MSTQLITNKELAEVLLKFIDRKISESELNERLKEQINEKIVHGEQWFRNPYLWYAMVANSNPYFTLESELNLLRKNSEKITKLISKKTQIFYGVGTGDSEMEIVNEELNRNKYVEVIAIDVINHFLEKFASGLLNKSKDNRKFCILFRGINALFQQIGSKDLDTNKSKYKNRVHICLGNTVGNFKNQNEILKIFESNSNCGDLLLLGFQLNKRLEVILERYKNAYGFNKLILNFIDNPDYSKLKYNINYEKSRIEGWYGDLLVFCSKKYNPSELSSELRKFSFELLFEVNDENCCIQIYKKNE